MPVSQPTLQLLAPLAVKAVATVETAVVVVVVADVVAKAVASVAKPEPTLNARGASSQELASFCTKMCIFTHLCKALIS